MVPAVVPGDNRLEALISSQYFTLARGFHFYRATQPPHPHRVDAKWQYIVVHKIQYHGKPITVGGLDRYFSAVLLLFNKDV